MRTKAEKERIDALLAEMQRGQGIISADAPLSNGRLAREFAFIRQGTGSKPNGLLVADGGEWVRLCVARGWPVAKHHYRVWLDMSRVISLHSASHVERFDRLFGETMENGVSAINWNVVSQAFGGISLWLGMDVSTGIEWYSRWDVGGCIWDETIILNLEEITV